MGNKASSNLNDLTYEELKMERWIQMHYQIKERETALELARQREFFYWFGTFYTIALFGSVFYYKRIKHPMILLPMFPLSFIMGYYADYAYGNKLQRIKAEANMIMQHEADLLHWPGGLPTVATIDEARAEAKMEKKIHPHNL